MKYYLALCCIAKDEEFFVEEWLCYHSLLGVEHFYVYDNMSAAPLRHLPAVRRFMDQGRLTLMEAEGHGRQMPSYDHCLRVYGPECRWIGFIDLDEFVYIQNYTDLRAFMAEFEPYAGLILNWRTFSSNGHLRRPTGLVMDNYTERLHRPDADLHFKSLVDPRYAMGAKNPHTFIFAPGAYCVSENHTPIPAEESLAPPIRRRAWINHYYYRSQQDFERKVLRGRASVTPDKGGKRLEAFYEQTRFLREEDTSIRRFSPAVRKAMEQKLIPLFLAEPPHCGQDSPTGLQPYLDMARSLILQKQWEKAECALCRAAIRFDSDPLLWLTRAFIARQKREYARAEQFIYQALSLGELPQNYTELIRLRLELQQNDEARDLLFYLRHSPTLRVREENFQLELAELEEKAGKAN
ncbi:MAG: glycosyltransferase family 92 protein [Deltaproteobacteria bacterium]|jgi:hypothetical protein|nr:glycosyltransferase family 92 protein [Deltaproteobacteria bacterium]